MEKLDSLSESLKFVPRIKNLDRVSSQKLTQRDLDPTPNSVSG